MDGRVQETEGWRQPRAFDFSNKISLVIVWQTADISLPGVVQHLDVQTGLWVVRIVDCGFKRSMKSHSDKV